MAIPTPARDFVRLLDIEPDLAARLREDDRAEARELLRLRVTELPPGDWNLEPEGTHGRPFGLVVVDGLLLQEVQLAGRAALQLLGPGDFVLPHSPAGSLDVTLRWTAAVPTRVGLLDDRLQRPFALWPGLAIGLAERSGTQLARVAVQTAIAQLPRVDQRLEATFWQLADRWGRVTPSGIHIPLELTHEILARMVGGRRPTITLALAELAERGVVARRPDRTWLIAAPGPTLPSGGPAEPAAPRVVVQTEPAAGTVIAAESPWAATARQELLETARQMRAHHDAQERRFRANLARSEAVCRHSRRLRDQLDGARRERLAKAFADALGDGSAG